MRRLFTKGIAGIVNPDLWTDNPFLARDWRRDLRRNQPFTQIVLMCGALLLGALWLWRTIVVYTNFQSMSFGRSFRLPSVYAYVGGDVGSCAFVIASGVQVWFVARSAQLRASRVLSQEVARDRMTDLLMLPADRQRTLFQAALYPWIHAMGLSITLLPVYLFCIFVGSVSWSDVEGIYILFAMVALCVPIWRRPALNENTGLSPGGQTAAGAETEALEVHRSASRGIRVGSAGGIYLAILIPFIWVFLALINRSSALNSLADYVPVSVVNLIPGAIITWPLIVARLLFTPLDWFGAHIPPILLVPTFVIVRQYLQLIRTSEYLSVGRFSDLSTLPTFHERRRAQQLLGFCGMIVVCGYLWKPLVADGGLAYALQIPTRTGRAELAFLFVSLFASAWWTLLRAGALGRWMGGWISGPNVTVRIPLISVIRFLAAPSAIGLAAPVIGIFLLGSRTWPDGATSLVISMLAVTAAGAMFGLGANRFLGYGALLGLCFAALSLCGSSYQPFATLSPTMGLAAAADRILHTSYILNGSVKVLPSPYSLLVVQTLLGIVFYVLASARLRKLGSVVVDRPEIATPVSIDPTIVGAEPLRDRSADKKLRSQQSDSQMASRAVAVIQKIWDNPIAVKEMRARLRSRLSAYHVFGALVILLAISILLSTYLHSIGTIGSGMADLLYGSAIPTVLSGRVASMQGCWYILLLLSAIGCGWNVLPRVFAVEVQKSTLPFLLASPMKTRAIILGKVVGAVISGSLVVWTLSIWTFILSLILVLMLGSLSPLAGWANVMLTAFTGLITIAMIMALVGTLFPRLGTVKLHGCIRIIIVYAVLQTIGMFGAITSMFFVSLDMSGHEVWQMYLVICVGISILCGFLAISALGTKRQKDLEMGALKVKKR